MLNPSGRQVGITLPNDQITGNGKAPAKRVTHIMPAQMYAIRYGDEFGKEHNVVLLRVGNAWYFPPNAETWASQLRPCSEWLVKEMQGKLALQEGTVPTQDAVDVVSAGIAADDSTG